MTYRGAVSDESTSHRPRRLGILVGATVAAAGVAISLVGGILGTRRQRRP